MTLPVELETSVNQLRAKHTALIDAVNAYRRGTIDTSKQDLLTLADDIDKKLTVEEHTLLGQVARKSRMPALLVDFTNGKYAVGTRRLERFTSLGELLTFSHSTGGGRFNAQGQYEWVPAGTPRIYYDPVTGECLGLSVEGQKTNLIPWSEDLRKWGTGSVTTVAPSSIPSPSGQLDAYQVLYPDGSLTAGRVSMSVTSVTPEGTYTFSVYVFKASEDSRAEFRFSGGDLGSVMVFTSAPISNAPVGRWARVSITFTLPPGEGSITLWAATRGDGMENLHFWGFQLEEGSFPTSYMPTEGTAVTRAADDAVIELSDALNPNEGTYVVRAVVKDDGEIEYYAGWYGNPVSSRVSFKRQANGYFGFRAAGSQLAAIGPPEYLKAGDIVTLAVAYNKGQMTAAGFGETSTFSAGSQSGYTPSSSINLVRRTGDSLSDNNQSLESSGNIAGFEYYPRALSESELQELTSL